MPSRLIPILLLALSGGAYAQSETAASASGTDAAPPGLTDQAAALWRSSQEQAGSLWQRSRETADDWWQRSRELTLDAWQNTRDSLTPAEADAFGQVWTTVVPKLEQTVALEEAQRDLPERAWFRRDRHDVREDIDQLLDESVAILSTSPVQQYRERIRALEQQIVEARSDLSDYRKQRVAAPTKSLTAKTVDDYDRLIDAREQDVERYKDELDRIKREFAADLRAMGLELSDEQVEFLLSTVVGDNLVDLGIVFDNVKSITVQLERLVRDSGEDLQSARRYYGMYVVLLRALSQMHLDVEQAIEQRYIPEINDIADRAKALSAETRALQRRRPEKAEVLAANLQAQQMTIDAAAVYRDYLKQQVGQVKSARDALQEDIETAWNTYETVRVSGELVDLVRSSQQLLDGLLNRQVPALRPFQNLEMQREFAKLTEQLRAARE
jgi:DNA repair exonuclease SbcCD ATPase subunit